MKKSDLEEFGRKSGLFDEIFVKRLGRHEFEPFQLEVREVGKETQRSKTQPHRRWLWG